MLTAFLQGLRAARVCVCVGGRGGGGCRARRRARSRLMFEPRQLCRAQMGGGGSWTSSPPSCTSACHSSWAGVESHQNHTIEESGKRGTRQANHGGGSSTLVVELVLLKNCSLSGLRRRETLVLWSACCACGVDSSSAQPDSSTILGYSTEDILELESYGDVQQVKNPGYTI